MGSVSKLPMRHWAIERTHLFLVNWRSETLRVTLQISVIWLLDSDRPANWKWMLAAWVAYMLKAWLLDIAVTDTYPTRGALNAIRPSGKFDLGQTVCEYEIQIKCSGQKHIFLWWKPFRLVPIIKIRSKRCIRLSDVHRFGWYTEKERGSNSIGPLIDLVLNFF